MKLLILKYYLTNSMQALLKLHLRSLFRLIIVTFELLGFHRPNLFHSNFPHLLRWGFYFLLSIEHSSKLIRLNIARIRLLTRFPYRFSIS